MSNILIATCGDCESIDFTMNNRRGPICLVETLYEQMIHNSNLCDVTLEFCGVVRRAHWCVLVNYPFFEAMYRSGLKETREGVIRISEGNYEAIQAAIHFMYTGNVRLDCGLLSEVLHVADYLQISNLVQLCEQCLLTLKTPNTCVDTYLLSRQYCLTINEELVLYIINNLAEVIQYPQNGQILTLNMIQEILLHESAYDVPQEVLYQFYRKWFAYDVNCRKGDFEDLFCSLNLQDTSHSFFKSLECDYIQTLKRCRDHYYKAKREYMGNRLKHSNEIVRVIIVVGEIEISVNNIVKNKRNVFACEIGSAKWSNLAFFPRDLDWYDKYIVETDGTALYVMANRYCDFYDTHLKIKVHKFDFEAKCWSILKFSIKASYSKQLRFCRLVCVNQRMFAAAKSRLHWQQPNALQLFELDEINQCCNPKLTVHAASNKLEDVKICAVETRFVYVKCIFLHQRPFGTDKLHKMALLDTYTGKTKRFSTVTQAVQDEDGVLEMEELIFPSQNNVIISKVDCPYYKVLNVVNGQISTVNERLLPRDLFYASDQDAEQETDLDIQIGCGPNVVSVFDITNERFNVFDFDARALFDVPPLPHKIIKSTTVHCDMKSKFVKCPIDCPHCLYELRAAM